MDMTNYEEYQSISEVPPFSIIEALNKEYAKRVIETLLQKFKAKDLQEHWRMNKDKYYETVIFKYNIETRATRPMAKEVPKSEWSLEAIFKMPFDKAKEEVQRMYDEYGTGRLEKFWEISPYQMKNKVYAKYDTKIETRQRGEKPVEKKISNKLTQVTKPTVVQAIPTSSNESVPVVNTQIFPYVQIPVKPVEEDFEGFKIGLKGEFEGTKLVKRLEGLLMSLSDNCKYKITLELIEMETLEEKVDTTV